MATGLFTALFNALSDPKSYYAMQKEVNLKAVAQTFFNSFAGKTVFEGIILPEDIGKPVIYDGQRAVRLRIPEIHDLIIPEPCSFEDIGIRKRLLSLHPVAYPDVNVPNIDAADKEPDSSNGDIRVVECFFRDGPQSSGRLRGLTYRPKTFRNAGTLGINTKCLYAETTEEVKDNFENGGYEEYGPPVPVAGAEGSSSGVLAALRTKQANYVKESTKENIQTYKTSDGKTHYPIKRVYNGSVEAFKGKKFSNGLLPQELIGQSSSATGYPALFLKDAVEDFDRLAQAFEQRFNKKLELNDSYRTFNRQIQMKNSKIEQKKPNEAAKPGTSNHGWGLAFDFSTWHNGVNSFQSETYKWMLKNAPRFGFENPKILRDGVGSDEAWHIQWIKIKEIWS